MIFDLVACKRLVFLVNAKSLNPGALNFRNPRLLIRLLDGLKGLVKDASVVLWAALILVKHQVHVGANTYLLLENLNGLLLVKVHGHYV